MRFAELSHTIEDGMITYPGLPAPRITTWLSFEASRSSYAPGTEFQIGEIDLVANTGTYLDSPAHRFDGGPDMSDLPLERLANLPICLVRIDPARAGRAIGPEAFAGLELRGRAVLVHTGWDRNWGTAAYLAGNPFLTGPAAELVAGAGATLLGIDSLNVDDPGDPSRPAHTVILRAGIPLVEHLCGLEVLPRSGGRFFAVPARVRGMATFPVRAFAILDEESAGS